MKRREKQQIADCIGGEIVRCHVGLVRVLGRKGGSQRWALMLNEDLSETTDHVWLTMTTRIVEMVQDAATRPSGGTSRGDEDPLLGRDR